MDVDQSLFYLLINFILWQQPKASKSLATCPHRYTRLGPPRIKPAVLSHLSLNCVYGVLGYFLLVGQWIVCNNNKTILP